MDKKGWLKRAVASLGVVSPIISYEALSSVKYGFRECIKGHEVKVWVNPTFLKSWYECDAYEPVWMTFLNKWYISIPSVAFGIFGARYLINEIRHYKSKLGRLSPKEHTNQNLERSIEEYNSNYDFPPKQQPAQESSSSYQESQEHYQDPTDLETQIAQLRNEIQELESN